MQKLSDAGEIAQQIILASGGDLKRLGEATALIEQYGRGRYEQGGRDADKTPNPWK